MGATQTQEEKFIHMTQEPVPHLICELAGPTIISMLVTSFYNMADTFFVGQVGTSATGAVGIAFSVMAVIQAFGFFFGHGSGNYVSRKLGAQEFDEAAKMAATGFVSAFIMGLVIMAAGLAFLDPLCHMLGATDTILPYARSYLGFILIGAPYMTASLVLNNQLRFQGSAFYAMIGIASGAVINIVLDPIFIFWLDLGVQGAAWATVIAQGCSAVWVLVFLTGRKAALRLRPRYMVLKPARVRKIVSLGLSGFFMNLTNSLVQVVCNATLQFYGGDLYVGIMTIINSVREVFFMPVHGLTNGSQPVMGYNYGAGKYGRVRQSIRFGCGLTVAYAAAFWALAMAFPGLMIQIFNDEPEVIQAGIPALRIYFALFIPMSLQSAGQAVFVALGRSKQAVFFSLLRKAIINAPLTVILPIWIGTNGVFIAEAVSQLVGGLACFVTMYCTVYRPLGRLKDDTPLPARR